MALSSCTSENHAKHASRTWSVRNTSHRRPKALSAVYREANVECKAIPRATRGRSPRAATFTNTAPRCTTVLSARKRPERLSGSLLLIRLSRSPAPASPTPTLHMTGRTLVHGSKQVSSSQIFEKSNGQADSPRALCWLPQPVNRPTHVFTAVPLFASISPRLFRFKACGVHAIQRFKRGFNMAEYSALARAWASVGVDPLRWRDKSSNATREHLEHARSLPPLHPGVAFSLIPMMLRNATVLIFRTR